MRDLVSLPMRDVQTGERELIWVPTSMIDITGSLKQSEYICECGKCMLICTGGRRGYLKRPISTTEYHANTIKEKDNTINTLKNEIEKLNKELKVKDGKQQTEIFELKRKVEVERENIQMRLDNIVDEVKELKMKNRLIQSENEQLRSKLQDVKIQFDQWNTVSSRISSILNRDETAGDLEKENENLKETIQKIDSDKLRLENELSLTLKKLLESREECNTLTERYEKCEHIDCMPGESLNRYSKENVQCQEHMLQKNQVDEDDMNQLAIGANSISNNRNISSSNNVYNITAAAVNIMKNSTVNLEQPPQEMNSLTSGKTSMEIEN